jgi:hypothetical protein
MMNNSYLTPIELSEHPELAALRILKTSLDVTHLALLATYPESSERCRTEEEAYAIAILYQIDALEAMVNEYVESTRRLAELRNREASEEDISF